jgi:8-oxo-dGTP pyrophosphatase MutT (NUDIX family)
LSDDARAAHLSAGVVVVRRAQQRWLFLMLRAYRNWDFPKGMVEPGEAPLEAACREVREETEIHDLEFRWGEGYRETELYGRRKIARYYVAATRTQTVRLPVNDALGRPEHNEWRWLDLPAARALVAKRLEPILRWAAETIGAP